MKRTNFQIGRVSNQEVATEQTKDLPANVQMKEGTFRINVKDEEDKVLYSNDAEKFDYPEVPALETALEYFGAELTEDQKTFLKEALSGSEKTGEAVTKIVSLVNDDLRTSAKNNAYQRIFNQHKPLTEENIDNATASIIRNFLKLNSGVSDETALTTLQGYGVVPKEYTIADFRGNKGKR